MALHDYDIVIRGGMVVDGTGAAPFAADVAVSDGRIAAVGAISGTGAEEIDARGQLVTPGFVDIHTHYDGQASWDERMQPSSWHGVTTVLMGNCGVGFAPCRPRDRDMLVEVMEGVEDIPEAVLNQGLPWNWETFPQYLDALAERRFDVDIGAQVPHAAVRVFVMGDRGARREPATAADIAGMRAIVSEGITAGAFGCSTSRAYTHKTKAGEPTPTISAADDELMGLALGLKDAGRGFLQYVGSPALPVLPDLIRASGRPLSFQMAQSRAKPDIWRDGMATLEAADAEGLAMRAQVCGRPVGILLGLDLTMNPFSLHPSYRSLEALPLAEKIARLSDPQLRARLLGEDAGAGEVFDRETLIDFANMFLLGDGFDYEPAAQDSIGALAAARGIEPAALALDHMLSDGGRGIIFSPFANYAHYNLDDAREMLVHPLTLSGLSDGGAHVGMICDGSFPTYMLTHWTRDRARGAKLGLAEVIKMQTSDTAAWMGLDDRGRIAPGLRADLNVIDYDRLTLHPPEVVHDFPAAGRRLLQRATGYTATLVAGVVTYRNGQETGALPGRLLRSGAMAA